MGRRRSRRRAAHPRYLFEAPRCTRQTSVRGYWKHGRAGDTTTREIAPARIAPSIAIRFARPYPSICRGSRWVANRRRCSFGCLIKEQLRLWRSDSRGECVRPRIRPRSGRSRPRARARTSLETGPLPRIGRSTLPRARRGEATFRCRDLAPTEASDALWAAAAAVFRSGCDAIARGEWIVIDRRMGPSGETYAVAGARKRPAVSGSCTSRPRLRSRAVVAGAPAGSGVGVSRRPPTTRRSKRWVTFSRGGAMWRALRSMSCSRFGKHPTARGRQRDARRDRRLVAECRAEIEELHATRRLLEGA